jgi:hypothetical protein
LFKSPSTPSIGASGAVFGLIGALLVVERRFGSNTGGVLAYLAILLLPGMLLSNVDWHGHIGGLLTGFALGALYAYAPRPNRMVWHIGGAVAVCVVLAMLVNLRTQHLRNELNRELSFDDLGIQMVEKPCAVLHICDGP